MDLMRFVGPDLLGRGQVRTLRRLLEQIGDAAADDAVCALLWGWCEYLTGRYAPGAALARQVDGRLAAGVRPVLATPLRINVALGRGDVATALAARARPRLGDLPDPPRRAGHRRRRGLHVGRPRRRGPRGARRRGRPGHHRAPAHRTHHVARVDGDQRARGRQHRPRRAAAADGARRPHSVRPGRLPRCGAGVRGARRHRGRPRQRRADAVARSRAGRGGRPPTWAGRSCSPSPATRCWTSATTPASALLAEARTIVDRCVDPGIAGLALARAEARHRVADAPTAPVAALVEQLTDRELAVLRYLPTQLSLARSRPSCSCR